MPKHNQVIPNVHLRKDYERFIKTWFDQPGKKKSRKQKRATKAVRNFPRPVAGLLRPVIRCGSIKYNAKQRIGRGFSLRELKAAHIPQPLARSIGIAVDHRRTNLSEPTLRQNVQRLTQYRSKLVIFPRKKSHPKKMDAKPEQLEKVTQSKLKVLSPIRKPKNKLCFHKISEAEKHSKGAYFTLRQARSDARLAPRRRRRALKKAEAEKLKKKD